MASQERHMSAGKNGVDIACPSIELGFLFMITLVGAHQRRYEMNYG